MTRPCLRDLAVVNAAVGGDRGPPNSCSLAKRGPGGLAWVQRWNLLVTALQDPANDQPDKYRQRHQRHDERHPHHQDRGGPVSDVHAIAYPSLCHRNRTVTMCGRAGRCRAALVVDGTLVLVLVIVAEVVVAHRAGAPSARRSRAEGPRIFRTANLWLSYAACCRFRNSQ